MNINIMDYGAIADGTILCTKEIQAAIDDCSAAGGGRVIVPVGAFVSGTLWLKNHVELHLEHGSRLKDPEHPRPGQLICFVESKDILVENVTITNTPCWTLFLHGSEIITIHGVKIFNPNWCGNTDGIDIDSCKYVTVSDCIILTGDDAFAIRCVGY